LRKRPDRYAADLVSPQGRKGNPAARAKPKAAPARRPRRRLYALIFGVLFIVLFAVIGVSVGIGEPSVPSDAIAVVEDAPDGTITQEQFDRALTQTAARQGIKEVPPTDDPQYQLIADAAESDLILARWVLGEADERGIVISDREVEDELGKIKEQQFGSEKAFQKFLDQSGFTLDEAKARIKLQLVSDRIQKAVLPEAPDISDDEIKTFYEENIAQFQQPETRDVRVVLTKTEDEANQAKAALGANPDDKAWQTVAKKFSIDEATKSTGGLRQAVVAGQSEPALDDTIFSSDPSVVVGPFKGDAGFYVIEVEKVTPAKTTPLEDATDQIKQTLVATRQQQIATDFQQDFQEKWIARTFCADGYRIDRCANAEPTPDPCTKDVAETQGCPAPVTSTKPIAPGSNTVFGAPAAAGLPQGPITPASQAVPPGGAVPGLPPGTVPPTGAPQTAPPAGTVPPSGAAPPQTAPPPGG
jgi:foldase protein PrsA